MGCGCGSKNQPATYVYEAADGTTTSFGTEIEAKAAKVREQNRTGASGTVRTA